MIPLAELAAHFRLAEARLKGGQLTLEVHKALEHVADDARAMIGTERPEWAALAESTVTEKERLGYVGQVSSTDPLLRTGELRGSIEADAERRGNVIEGVVGSTSKIAVFLESGTSKMPARPFLAGAMIQSQPLMEETLGMFAVRILTPGSRF